MKNADFLEIAKAIADNGGKLDGVPISLKVDGAGIRFGKDQSGRPFFMTSKVTTPLYQDDVGYFTSFGQQRGQDAETLARTKKYDDALALITGSKFIQTLPSDTIVQAEMMYNPMAQQTDQGLKFVNIPYDPKKLGKQMTLVPFVFKQYSTGDERPDADRIKKRLLASSDSNIKIVSNNLEQKGINVSKIINPILNLDPKDKANKPAFDQAKQALSDAIINNPKLAGKDALGDNMEGVVVNMPNGQMFKVTSQQMKSSMAAKMAQPGAKQQGPAKTAVVAVGSFAGHLGHEDLFNATINKAKQLGGDPYLFIGNAIGKDDPIPTDVKVQTWHKLYPQYADNISATMQGGSLMQKIKHELINPQPGKPPKYDNIVIMVGEDRKDMPLAGALMKAVNKFPGYEHVKVSLETIPRTRPISFTKLRDVLKNPNATPEQQYAVWAQGFNAQQLGKDWILHLMDISRKGMGITAQPAAPQAAPQPAPVAEVRLFNALVRPSLLESTSSALAHTAKSLENPPKVMQHRARRDMERDQQLKGRDIAKRNEEFNGEYDDEAGMAQSNLRTMARAVDGLLKTIKSNDNLPEWGQEKIAKAEMMLVSVWDYLQSQKELGMDPKVDMAEATSAAIRLQRAIERQRAKSDASLRRTPSSIPKPEPKKEQGVAEGLSKRDQRDVAAIRAAIARLEAQLNHPNADRDAIQQSIAHEKKRLALYGVTEGAPIVVAQAPIHIRNPKKAPQPYRNQGDIVPPTKPPSTEKRGVKGRPGQRPMPDRSVAESHQSAKTIEQIKFWYKDAADAVEMAKAAEALNVNGMYDEAIKKYKHQAQISLSKANSLKQGVAERMLPKSAFAGSDKNKLGPAAHAKGKQKGPVKKGQFVGGMEEEKKKGADGKACWKGYRYAGTENGKDKCVPVGEDVENIMGALIENLIRK
jgi:hypothetical protein